MYKTFENIEHYIKELITINNINENDYTIEDIKNSESIKKLIK